MSHIRWQRGLGAGKVVAVEPNPTAYRRLTFNVKTNEFDDFVALESLALGSSVGEAMLSVPTGSIGGSKIGDLDNVRERVRVPMRPLASLLVRHGITRIDVLKIDIEGMEDCVLSPFFAGAPRELWPKCVIIEHTMRREWDRDILEFMLGNGYRTDGRTRTNTLLVKA